MKPFDIRCSSLRIGFIGCKLFGNGNYYFR